MEHFMRIAFWIFTLSATLSDCYPTPTYNYIPDFNIKFMKSLKCDENGTFYTPESTDETCYKSALQCIFRELQGTAPGECDDKEGRIKGALDALERKLNNMEGSSNSSACVCEKWPQKSFLKFLENYESLLQKENAAVGRT